MTYSELDAKFRDLINHEFPTSEFVTVAGDSVKPQDFKNGITVVNFFFLHCKGCMLEVPYLNRLQKEYADKGVKVIAITHEPKINIEEFNDKLKFSTPNKSVAGWYNPIQYPVICISKAKILKDYFLRANPTTMIIDAEGIIRFMDSGFPEVKEGKEQTYKKYTDAIEKLL
jgi:peroxiredoxin